jgi:hypothetical protein
MPDELNPDRPLPWKVVRIGDVWDVTNDAGDPRDEYSVFEYATEGEARFVVRACNAHADLIAACEAFLDVTNQDGMALAFDMATRAVAKAKGGA